MEYIMASDYEIFEGKSLSGLFKDIYENTKTPNCFPTNNPKTIPKGTLSRSEPSDKPSNETPAFAKAKRGIIPNATYGLIACSTFINSEKSFSFFL